MQKISSYLYPNRVELLTDLAGFTTEYTNVYQRTVKIYKGVDNVIEFDIKNADQKRLELNTSPLITDIALNVMDSEGNKLPNSPYMVTPNPTIKGIAGSVIPASDLANINHQFLRYSVTATQGTSTIPLYADSRFGAVGTIEVVGTAMPITRPSKTYNTFYSEVDLNGVPTWHSSAIPSVFYEAVPTTHLSFSIKLTGFVGSVWIETTNQAPVSVESWKHGSYLWSTTYYATAPFTGTVSVPNLAINDSKYFRVSYTTPTMNGLGSSFIVDLNSDNTYTVTVRAGGTGYAPGSQIKVIGSALGGVDGVNDLIISVVNVDGAPLGTLSSYTASGVNGISWTGVAGTTSGRYIVSGTNITGTVDSVVVS